MSYTLNKTNGESIIISDGTVDQNSTSLVLIGKNYAGYGAFLNDNFIKLLENFANTTSPPNPLKGQLWWDTTNNILKVYSGASWKISTGATSAPASSPPGDLSALGGDLWYDTTNSQLKVYTGTNWIVVGPSAVSALQTTGAFSATVNDTGGGTHKVIQIQFNGVVYAMFAYETFATALPGFASIKPGLNFNTLNTPSWVLSTQDINATPLTLVQRDSSGGIFATAATLTGQATFGPVTATSVTSQFTGNLVGNVNATTVTSTNIIAGGVNASSGYTGTLLTAAQPNITSLGNLTALKVAGNLDIYGYATYKGAEIATTGGTTSFTNLDNTPIGATTPNTGRFTTVTVLNGLVPASNLVINLGAATGGWWNGFWSNTAVHNTLTSGTINAGNVVAQSGTFNSLNLAAGGDLTLGNLGIITSITPTSNVSANIGSSTRWFNTIFGRAIQAQYADLAERFHADAEYAPGTVVELGGTAEITKVEAELSEKVFGVISTSAAYLMNSGAGTNATHPPIAVSGRVPVRAVGLISKGDRLVSAGNGIARAGAKSEISPWNVIGRSLVNKNTPEESLIEAIVKINS